jgi:hypothetical protein
MPDRASYLARLLTSRLSDLKRAAMDDEAEGARGSAISIGEREVVAKVLAVEEGITDQAIIDRIAAAAPVVEKADALAERDVTEFADFLRSHLRLG